MSRILLLSFPLTSTFHFELRLNKVTFMFIIFLFFTVLFKYWWGFITQVMRQSNSSEFCVSSSSLPGNVWEHHRLSKKTKKQAEFTGEWGKQLCGFPNEWCLVTSGCMYRMSVNQLVYSGQNPAVIYMAQSLVEWTTTHYHMRWFHGEACCWRGITQYCLTLII